MRATVLQAALAELLDKGFAGLSIGAVARRSGVHPTSIYRRWKTIEQLTMEAALEAANSHIRIADTGSLRADLTIFLADLDVHVRSPLGRALLALSSLAEPAVTRGRDTFWRTRFDKAKIIFGRAATRGEISATTDVTFALEFTIAPIYLRAIVLDLPSDDAVIALQVETILRAFAR